MTDLVPTRRRRRLRFAASLSLLPLLCLAPESASACATCGCSLNADAVTGYSEGTGWQLDLQYNYIDQSQLRSGNRPIAPGLVALINNQGGSQEVEHDTVNRYLTAGVGYSFNEDWTFTLQIPYVDRSHSTYGNATTDALTPANLSGVSYGDLGDIRLIATYKDLFPGYNFGIQAGVKLPTGRFGGQNTVTGATVGRDPVFFGSGPNAAAGQTIDTSLQPGNGSTDLLVGAYYYQPVSEDVDAFANARFQVAALEMLDSVNANYRPGNSATVSVGLRYENNPIWVPQLQINISHKTADQGALADNTDTAGTVGYVSPGLTLRLDSGIHLFGFVQIPIFSSLAGYQLFPRWTATVGTSFAF